VPVVLDGAHAAAETAPAFDPVSATVPAAAAVAVAGLAAAAAGLAVVVVVVFGAPDAAAAVGVIGSAVAATFPPYLRPHPPSPCAQPTQDEQVHSCPMHPWLRRQLTLWRQPTRRLRGEAWQSHFHHQHEHKWEWGWVRGSPAVVNMVQWA